jgi:hypothetical protein
MCPWTSVRGVDRTRRDTPPRRCVKRVCCKLTHDRACACPVCVPRPRGAQGRGGLFFARGDDYISYTPAAVEIWRYRRALASVSFHISLFMSFLLSSGNYFRPAPAQARRHQQRSGWFRSKATAGLGTWWKPPSHARQRTRAVAQRMTWTILHRHTQRLPLGTQLLLQEVGRPSTSTCNHALRARPALMV